MNRLTKWLSDVRKSYGRHARLFHETQHRIIKDKIESDPVKLLERIRRLERKQNGNENY